MKPSVPPPLWGPLYRGARGYRSRPSEILGLVRESKVRRCIVILKDERVADMCAQTIYVNVTECGIAWLLCSETHVLAELWLCVDNVGLRNAKMARALCTGHLAGSPDARHPGDVWLRRQPFHLVVCMCDAYECVSGVRAVCAHKRATSRDESRERVCMCMCRVSARTRRGCARMPVRARRRCCGGF